MCVLLFSNVIPPSIVLFRYWKNSVKQLLWGRHNSKLILSSVLSLLIGVGEWGGVGMQAVLYPIFGEHPLWVTKPPSHPVFRHNFEAKHLRFDKIYFCSKKRPCEVLWVMMLSVMGALWPFFYFLWGCKQNCRILLMNHGRHILHYFGLDFVWPSK